MSRPIATVTRKGLWFFSTHIAIFKLYSEDFPFEHYPVILYPFTNAWLFRRGRLFFYGFIMSILCCRVPWLNSFKKRREKVTPFEKNTASLQSIWWFRPYRQFTPTDSKQLHRFLLSVVFLSTSQTKGITKVQTLYWND